MTDDPESLPEDGPRSGISVTLTAGTLNVIRDRVGKRGISAYLARAAQRQIERDNLTDSLLTSTTSNGPADPEAVAAKRAKLLGPAAGTEAAASVPVVGGGGSPVAPRRRPW
ncbi:hypothetical protein [Streptomyces oceani]|uniref:hypothetical protein n=1 Tax=Streptomyces oceani TaxID=1075402 RepID=UPI0009A0E5F5|nr:hypothetical protein [Streptomyces oceani]